MWKTLKPFKKNYSRFNILLPSAISLGPIIMMNEWMNEKRETLMHYGTYAFFSTAGLKLMTWVGEGLAKRAVQLFRHIGYINWRPQIK